MSLERRKFLRTTASASMIALLRSRGFARKPMVLAGETPASRKGRIDSHKAPPLMNVLSHVAGGNTIGGEVREPSPRFDGYFHIDTPGTIARLKQLHANTHNYLIWNSPTDWDDLRKEFLPAAQHAGIKVWAYLAPPAETYTSGKGSDPYRLDYEKWAQELAKLSLRYPALVAWAMDDLTWNMKKFTPSYVATLQRTAHAINALLRFFPVVHFTILTAQWSAEYSPYIDGVICPFIDLPYNNTQRVTSLNRSINDAHKHLPVPVYVLLYAGRHLTSPLEPTPEYITAAMEIALRATDEGRAGGVISYGTELDPQPLVTRPNQALEGLGRLSLAAAATKSPVGDFAQASQKITIDPASPRYSLSFWHHDSWGPPHSEKGQYDKQVLINDQVVWHCDPAIDVPVWMEGSILQGPLNLTKILKGQKTATLTLRVLSTTPGEKGPIDVSFDHLRATGFTVKNPEFESGDGWSLKDNGQGLLAAIDRFATDRLERVFDAVAKAYGDFRS